jgi:hypothetical protein
MFAELTDAQVADIADAVRAHAPMHIEPLASQPCS